MTTQSTSELPAPAPGRVQPVVSRHRVVFTFDDRSLSALHALKADMSAPSLAAALRESLRIARAIQGQQLAGFTELLVRNPVTHEERIICVPSLVG